MDEQSLENTGKGGQNTEVLIESKRSTEDILPLHLSPNPRNQIDFNVALGSCNEPNTISLTSPPSFLIVAEIFWWVI